MHGRPSEVVVAVSVTGEATSALFTDHEPADLCTPANQLVRRFFQGTSHKLTHAFKKTLPSSAAKIRTLWRFTHRVGVGALRRSILRR